MENHHIAQQQAYYGKPVDERHEGLPHPGTFLLDAEGVVVGRQFEQSYRWRPAAPALLEDLVGGPVSPPIVSGTDGSPGLALVAWVETVGYRAQEIGRVQLSVQVEPGHHVYVAPTPPGYTPLTAQIAPMHGLTTTTAQWPAGEPLRLEGLDEEFLALSGTARSHIPFRIEADQGPVILQVRVGYQACDDVTCLLPGELAVELPLTPQGRVG